MRKILIGLFGTCWLLVTFAALAGMYHLWWQRERVLYFGKTVEQQRKVVFQRAGLPTGLADKVNFLARQWPSAIRYKASGDATSLSYIQYLLLPRIPAENASHTLQVKGDDFLFTSGSSDQQFTDSVDTNNPVGLIFSFFILTGWAVLLRQLWRNMPTWPESFALSCFFLTLLTLPIRFFFYSVNMAFSGAVMFGIIGWITTIFNYFRKEKRIGCSEKIKGALFALFYGKKKGERLFVALLLGIIFAAIFWTFIMSVVVVPDDWDAWAIWGSKAKVLAQGTGPLHDLTGFGHSDYPLLWPTVWAFSAWLSGGWEECWSKGWGAVFLFFCVWEIILIVKKQSRCLTTGLLTGALFVSIPNIPLLASWSYAEAPLWLMMICGLGCFLRQQNKKNKGDAVLIGLFAAAAAYTKNEGVLFAVILGALLFGSSRRWQATAIYALTFTGCYLGWWYWSRIYYDLGSHATAGLHFDAHMLLRAAKRIPPACEAIFGMWKDIRQWNIIGFGIIITMFWALFKIRREKRRLLFLLLPISLLSGYFIIIIFHPGEIYWQIGTAWNRLTVQVLPLLLILLVPIVLEDQQVELKINKQ